ncbi:MAG: hypothetical protein KAR12_07195, partial [Methylococcales bacterium]|nr:hypothetical protein [Methylococcales bacterium]
MDNTNKSNTTGNSGTVENTYIVGVITGYITGAMSTSHFEQAIIASNKYGIPIAGSGINIAGHIVGSQVAFVAILQAGLSNGGNSALNAAFASAIGTLVGTRFGPAAGAAVGGAYGALLDFISNKTHEYDLGGKIYDLEQLFKDPEFLNLLEENLDNFLKPLLDPLNDLGHWLNDELYNLKQDLDEALKDLFQAAKDWVAPPPRVRYEPLALDLDGDGVESTALGNWDGVLFDHDNDGRKEGTGWVSGDDGILALDRNGNGIIDSGRELFGDNTLLKTGEFAENGLAALADLDENHDGQIDINDSNYANLRIWQDKNQDGISQSYELKTLEQLGIASISTSGETSSASQNGNLITHTSTFTYTDGRIGKSVDLDFAGSSFYTEYKESVALTGEDATRPNVHGSGNVRNLRNAAALSDSLANTLDNYSAATS